MTVFALVTGSLWKPPEQKTSKTGKPYVVASIRAKDGEALQWWRVTVFSETAQAEIMRLAEGDSLAVQGSFKAELYTPESGETKLSLSIIADRVLALRQPPRERAAKPTQRREWRPGDGPNDDIPFGAP